MRGVATRMDDMPTIDSPPDASLLDETQKVLRAYRFMDFSLWTQLIGKGGVLNPTHTIAYSWGTHSSSSDPKEANIVEGRVSS